MSPIIHLGIGWLIAQPLRQRRDRALVTSAAVIPDLDGVGLLISEDLYVAWHHKLAHGIAAAVVVTLVVLVLARSARAAALALAAFHTHIAADLVGSGPGWPIFYTWPFTNAEWLPSWQWDLASWQNTAIGLVVIFACLSCGPALGRTPVELASLRADRSIVSTLRARIGSSTPEGR